MKIFSIFGSPNKHGFSSSLHEKFLSPFVSKGATVDKFYIYEENIHPCNGCNYCLYSSNCNINDSMKHFYKFMDSYDLITLSSPIYFSSLPGPVKIFIDRLQIFWEAKRRDEIEYNEKLGVFFLTAGSDYKDIFLPTQIILKHVANTININIKNDFSMFVKKTDSFHEIPENYLQKSFDNGVKFFNTICT